MSVRSGGRDRVRTISAVDRDSPWSPVARSLAKMRVHALRETVELYNQTWEGWITMEAAEERCGA